MIGMDGIAILVHDSNPVKSLSIDQLQGIFSGETSNWKEVGGRDTTIRVFIPKENFGGRDVFEKVVMRGKQFTANAENFYVSEDFNNDPYDMIDYKENAITFASSSFYYKSAIRKKVHPMPIDGVEPTSQPAVANGGASVQVNGRNFMLEKWGEPVSATVYSLDGRLVSSSEASSSGISLNGIPAGIYIIVVRFANGESCTQKIICRVKV